MIALCRRRGWSSRRAFEPITSPPVLGRCAQTPSLARGSARRRCLLRERKKSASSPGERADRTKEHGTRSIRSLQTGRRRTGGIPSSGRSHGGTACSDRSGRSRVANIDATCGPVKFHRSDTTVRRNAPDPDERRDVLPRASSGSLFQAHSHDSSQFDVAAGCEIDCVYIATELAKGTMPQRPAQFQAETFLLIRIVQSFSRMARRQKYRRHLQPRGRRISLTTTSRG